MHLYLPTYIHTHLHAYIMHSYLHTCIHTCMHTYINTHTHTRTHTHTYNVCLSYIKLKKVGPSMQCPFLQLAIARLRQFKLLVFLTCDDHLTSLPNSHLPPVGQPGADLNHHWFHYKVQAVDIIVCRPDWHIVPCPVLSSRTVCSETRRNTE